VEAGGGTLNPLDPEVSAFGEWQAAAASPVRDVTGMKLMPFDSFKTWNLRFGHVGLRADFVDPTINQLLIVLSGFGAIRN
jgi:hypothetical protein